MWVGLDGFVCVCVCVGSAMMLGGFRVGLGFRVCWGCGVVVGFEWSVRGGVEGSWGRKSWRKGYTWMNMFVLVLVCRTRCDK